tara:strand:- start:34546 stop:35199 length:654 start_codon:yes stop_codon:yes gene_type:complete
MNKTELIDGMAEDAGISKAAAKKSLEFILGQFEIPDKKRAKYLQTFLDSKSSKHVLIPAQRLVKNKSKRIAEMSINPNVTKSIELISYDWNDDSRAYNILETIRSGIDYKTFDIIAKKSPLDFNDWSNVLETTTRTLERYKKDNKKLSSSQTEKIIAIQQLMNYGNEVFGSETNFKKWLLTENISLGGKTPKDLFDTTIGIGMVKDALGRIEHGIFA